MFAYQGSSKKELNHLFNALKKASACDECIKLAFPGNAGHHEHGWGYVLRTSNQLYHYRTTGPIYEDNHRLPEFEGEIQIIAHARLATGGVLGDPMFSHPYAAYTDQATFYFAHNGGLKNAAQIVPNKVDSEWAFDQVLREGDLATALPKLKENTSSALNLLVMTINRAARKATLHYHNFYVKYGEKGADSYYRMYQATMAEGGKAVFSSTMEPLLLKHITKGSNAPVKYGELLTLGASQA